MSICAGSGMSDRNSGTEFIDGLIAADRSFCRNSARVGLGRYALCDLGHFPKLRSYGSIGSDRGLAFQPKLSFFTCSQRTPQRKMTTGLISAYVRRIAPVSAALVPHVTFVMAVIWATISKPSLQRTTRTQRNLTPPMQPKPEASNPYCASPASPCPTGSDLRSFETTYVASPSSPIIFISEEI